MVDQADPFKNNIPKNKVTKKCNGGMNHIKGDKGKQAVHLGNPEFPQGIVKSAGVLNPEMSIGLVPLPVVKSSSVCNVAPRGVGRIRSFFDLEGTSSCSAGFSEGAGIAAEAGSVALQIPSSSISIPLPASAMAMAVHRNSSAAFFETLEPRVSGAAFFETLAPRVSGVRDDLPQGSECGPCVLADRCSTLEVSAERAGRAQEFSTVWERSTAEGGFSVGPARVSGFTRTLEILLCGMEEQDIMREWLQVLDFQAVGACRADERLRPLLRWNVSYFGGDKQLLAQLGLHFKAKELSSLARCLSTPLVSIRVGKIVRHGLILHPTSTRGFLRLWISPFSELQLSFKGDDDSLEMLGSITSGTETSLLVLEEISADPSGRSFTLKRNGQELACFWLSEKSKLAGEELLLKMKNLLVHHPTLAQLTGIEECHLEFLASYLPSALETSCSASMEISEASSALICPPTRTSASAVVPHFSSCDQCSPTSQHLQEGSLFRSLSINCALQSSHEGSSVPSQGLSSQTGGLLNQFLCSGELVVNPGESSMGCRELLGLKASPNWSIQHSSNRFPLNNVIDKSWNPSWSTRTSITYASNTVTESTSIGQMNYNQLESTSIRADQKRSWSTCELVINDFCLPVLSSPQTPFSFPSVMSEPPNSCNLLPPLSARLPMSSSSLFSPYYCPCPLGGVPALHYTFSPPCLPTVCSKGEFLPTSTFISVEASVSTLPPVPLELHKLQCSFPMPVSPLAPAELVMHSSGMPSMFGVPVSRLPVVSLHIPTQGYLLQALPVVSNLKSHVVSDYFQGIFTHHGDGEAIGRDRAFPSSTVGGRSWGTQAMVEGPVAEPDPLLNRICISSALLPELRAAPSKTQIREGITFSNLDAAKFSCDTGIPGVKDETQRDAIENILKLSLPALPGLPVLDITPRILSSSSLSRIVGFRTTGDSTRMNWDPNSLSLYSGFCDMKHNPVTLFPGSSKVTSCASSDRIEPISEGNWHDSTKLDLSSILEGILVASEAMKKVEESESESPT